MTVDAAQLVLNAEDGDTEAGRRLMPLLCEELRGFAAAMLDRGGRDSLLDTTALIQETYVRLAGSRMNQVKSRTHLHALAAVAMRHALIDHARGEQRDKRGGGWQRVTLSGACAVTDGPNADLLDLNDALSELSAVDEQAARVVELRFFGGLSELEVAGVLGISERSVRNDWSMARAWLRRRLSAATQSR